MQTGACTTQAANSPAITEPLSVQETGTEGMTDGGQAKGRTAVGAAAAKVAVTIITAASNSRAAAASRSIGTRRLGMIRGFRRSFF